MAYSSSRISSLLFSLVLGAGCGSLTDETPTDPAPADESPSPTTDDPTTPPTSGTPFRFFTSDAGGGARSTFPSFDEVFLTAGGDLDVSPGDYYFSVTYEVCPPGLAQDQYFPQQSPVACRAFRVGTSGEIVAGAAVANVDGVPCPHASTVTGAGLAIGVAPFELHPAACGGFRALVIPSGESDSAASAVAALFFTVPLPSAPVCGDDSVDAGEQCDDGNDLDGDGCSASCQLEPGCEV